MTKFLIRNLKKTRLQLFAFLLLGVVIHAQAQMNVCEPPPAGPVIPPSPTDYETVESCGNSRLYFLKGLQAVSPLYSSERDSFPEAEFPSKCLLYIQKNFLFSPDEPSQYFSYCPVASGAPRRGVRTHCVLKEYTQTIYNSYVDVMDCLDIPQKDLIPKLFLESGFHANTLGKGFDGGVGQLTDSAIAAVFEVKNFPTGSAKHIDYMASQMRKSGKASCQRILAQKNILSPVSSAGSQRCSIIGLPENPTRNIFYTGLFYHYMMRIQTGVTYTAGYSLRTDGSRLFHDPREAENFDGYFATYDIKNRLKKLGVEPNMAALRQMMLTSGYNAGVHTAFLFLKNYLDARELHQLPLTAADFDFQNQDMSLFWTCGDQAQENIRLKKLSAARLVAYKFSFPIFLRLVQKTGAPGYLTFAAGRSKKLNKEFGDGVCTSPKYLQF
jgi:hypothetical protein